MQHIVFAPRSRDGMTNHYIGVPIKNKRARIIIKQINANAFKHCYCWSLGQQEGQAQICLTNLSENRQLQDQL